MNRLKRKPYLFGLAAAAALLAVAMTQLASPSQAGSPRLERYMPADAVGFVEINDLRAQAVRVIESEAWREFTKENQAASSLFMITANHAGALDASYALGLVGVAEGGPQFVAVAEFDGAGARRVFERRIIDLANQADEKGAKAASEEYHGVTVKTVGGGEGQGKGFSYAKVENTLYLSNSPAVVRRALDVRAGRAPSLETNQNFVEARGRAGAGDGMFGFLDGAALSRLVAAAPEGEGEKGTAAFRQLFQRLGGDSVRSAAFTSTFEDGRVAERFVVVAPERSGVLATVASNPPTPQALLALVPEDALAAFDASVANAPQTFDHLFALASQHAGDRGGKGPADGLAGFAAKTGVDFRAEVVGEIGGEICVAQLPAGDGRAGVLILSVKDPAAFEQTLRKLAAAKGGAVAVREYRGVRVGRVEGGGFEYAFLGENVVLSGEGRAVERVIETAQGGPSLKASAAYAAASAGAAGAQFVYFNTNADYLGRLGRMIQPGDAGQKAQSPAPANRAGALRPSFAYGAIRPEGFFVESRTPLGIFPRMLTAVTSKFGGAAEGEAAAAAGKGAEEAAGDQAAAAARGKASE